MTLAADHHHTHTLNFLSTGIWTIARMDTIPNGRDPEWTRSRMDTIPNGHDPEWTRSQMDTIPNGHDPKWTQSRKDTIPNEHLQLYSYFGV